MTCCCGLEHNDGYICPFALEYDWVERPKELTKWEKFKTMLKDFGKKSEDGW